MGFVIITNVPRPRFSIRYVQWPLQFNQYCEWHLSVGSNVTASCYLRVGSNAVGSFFHRIAIFDVSPKTAPWALFLENNFSCELLFLRRYRFLLRHSEITLQAHSGRQMQTGTLYKQQGRWSKIIWWQSSSRQLPQGMGSTGAVVSCFCFIWGYCSSNDSTLHSVILLTQMEHVAFNAWR